MDEQTIEELARKFLSNQINLEIYSELPPDMSIYGLDKENEILVGFTLFEESKSVPTRYLAVSKSDGVVRYLGEHGE